MTNSHPGFRVFIIGAGFSVMAGLPLASELYEMVVQDIEEHYGKETKFHRDLEEYIDYASSCNDEFDKNSIDLEEFMSYLDIEHFLQLRGSKAWSDEGNESQIMMRKAIGRVIHKNTPSADSLPDAYINFVKNLSLDDLIITFNYDVILERALEFIDKPYRLFPDRFKSIGRGSNTIDSDTKEVTILKLHGSVDWFDDRHYLKMREYLAEQGNEKYAKHSVFSDPSKYKSAPIVDGPRSEDDSLLHIHRIEDVDSYYQTDSDFHAPFILSPSHVKFVYADPLLSFWHGMGRSGGYNLGISVIGFSLPEHDEYIRIALYKMMSNYQCSWWDEPMLGTIKDNVRIVDFQNDDSSTAILKARYSFLVEEKTEYYLNGFSDEAVGFLFNQPRVT